MDTKQCTLCGQIKPVSEFFKSGFQKSGKEKRRPDCKSCAQKNTMNWRIKNRSHYNSYVAMWRAKNPEKQHATEIKRHYGMSIEHYNELLKEQGLKCKICEKPHNPSKKRGRLYVDHCHDSNKIRGLLCSHCNSALGYLDHDISLLQKAIKYLSN